MPWERELLAQELHSVEPRGRSKNAFSGREEKKKISGRSFFCFFFFKATYPPQGKQKKRGKIQFVQVSDSGASLPKSWFDKKKNKPSKDVRD